MQGTVASVAWRFYECQFPPRREADMSYSLGERALGCERASAPYKHLDNTLLQLCVP